MATNAQPLLAENPKRKTSYHKAFCVLLSLVAVIGPIAFFTTKSVDTSSSLGAHVCDQAHGQASCLTMLSQITSGGLMQMNDVTLLQMILQNSTSHIRDTAKMANDVSRRINDPREQAALADCLELLDMAESRVVDSVVALGHPTACSHSDAHAWLSSVLTNHVTCLDGLSGLARPIMESKLNDLISRARTCLALLVSLSPFMKHDHVLKPLHGNFPSWVTSKDRKLLQAMPNAINANVVVAKDGSGNYKTIQEAVASAPDKSQSRYIIYVKAGTYKENIEIGKSKTNVMLTGDGMDKTIITGSLNVVDGSTTFKSATVGT